MALPVADLKKILVSGKIAEAKDLENFEKEAKEKKQNLADYLVAKQIVPEEKLFGLVSDFLQVPFVDLTEEKIPQEVLKIIPEPIARRHQVVAFRKKNNELDLAMTDPKDLQTTEFVKKKTGFIIKPFLASDAGMETALAQYRSFQISNYYACLHDTVLSNSPVFGIVFAGSSINYINLSSNTTAGNSFSLRLSQDVPGNEFIIPVTHTNCTVINTKLPEIEQTGTLLNPFVVLNEAVNAVELILGYPNIDISGSFDRSGAFTLVVEKNDTNENQIIVKPA